jgi:HD superfamily phosphohydrolase
MSLNRPSAGLVVHDILYGEFVLPGYVADLVLTPEVRRLSQIRLLNSLTPTVSALGEVRRYSHTLGVLHLAQQVPCSQFTEEEQMALAAAVLAHDIGTPPFGHVMEYHLTERKNWHHEAIIRNILLGTHAPENRAHQFFGGRTIDFVNALRRAGIQVATVIDIVTKQHPLSVLLFGTLDLDNLDNVARMATFVGNRGCARIALRIAQNLGVSDTGNLILPHNVIGAVKRWSGLRRKVYDLLLFDPFTAASQAVLWDAIRIGFEEGFLTEDDAFLTDEQLLEELRQHPQTKDRITLEYLGKPPNMALCLQLRGTMADVGLASRREAQCMIERVLRDVFRTDTVLGYVQLDSGTIEKRLEFCTQEGEPWTVGVKSTSVIFYGFVRQELRESTCRKASHAFLEALAVPLDSVLRNQVAGIGANAQPAFNFSSAQD